MKNKVRTFFALFYFLLPRFIREQYNDSFHFYKTAFIRNIRKLTREDKDFTLSLVNNINALGCPSKMLEDKDFTLSLVNNINALGCPSKMLYVHSDRTSTIHSPKLYIEGQYYHRKELRGSVPEISLILCENVMLIGTTDALIYEDKLFHNELSQMKSHHDLKRFNIFKKDPDTKDKYTLTISEDNLENGDKTIYISLLKEHSSNYYHFVTEALPRLITTLHELGKKEDFDGSDYTLLIDCDVPAQCIEIVSNLTHDDMPIQFVKHGHLVKCQKLIYCNPLWLSLDNTTSLPNPQEEFFVDLNAIKLVKNTINKVFKSEGTSNPTRKVYLQRLNNKLRPITNILEVEKLLYKYGFEFIDTSHMSFKEQYILFSETSVVFGASGASFTNILFMSNSTTAISLYPSAQSTNYYVFQPLADASKINLIHFLTDSINDTISPHGESTVNIVNLDKLFKEVL